MNTEVDYNSMSKEEAKEYFDKNYNIGYVDDSLPTPPNSLIFQHYISACLVYGFATIFLLFNPYFIQATKAFPRVSDVIVCLYLAYIVLAPIFLFWLKPRSVYVSHSIDVVNYMLKVIKRDGLKKDATATEFLAWLTPDYRQKQALMLFFIKFFFGPQMCTWFWQHISNGIANYKTLLEINDTILASGTSFIGLIKTHSEELVYYRNYVYLTLVGFLYFIDTFVFSVGYCTELPFLKNKIRTVEITPFGIFICLLCYPPFSSVSVQFFPYSHNETLFTFTKSTSILIWITYVVALILIALYVSASVALFTKASNLTNRGTVSIFPYNIVRHPAYVTKILAWYLGSISLISIFVKTNHYLQIVFYVLAAILWTVVYYFRAITEERHMSLDPDYREYCKKVKYRFIPYVW